MKVVSGGEAGGARQESPQGDLAHRFKGLLVGTSQSTSSATRRQDSTFFWPLPPRDQSSKEFPLAEEVSEGFPVNWLPQLLSPVLRFIASGGRE